MASMIAYIGVIDAAEDGQPSSARRWDGALDLGENLTRVGCPYTQLRVLLEQSIAAAYYLKFYGPRCHEVVTDFIEELNNDITYRFERQVQGGRVFNDNYLKIYQTLQNLVKFNRGGNWTDVDLALVDEFLFDGSKIVEVPVIERDRKRVRGVIIPFLMWMNRGLQANYAEFVNDPVGTMWFAIEDCYRCEGNYKLRLDTTTCKIGTTFYFEKIPLDQINSCPILGYLSHFSWVGSSFERVVGLITNYCFHNDIERYGLSGTHHLAYALKQGAMFPTFDVTGAHDGIEPIMSKYHDQLFNALLAFVNFNSSRRGLKVVDREIVARAFGCIAYTKEQKESAHYLKEADATASADDLKSFNEVMGSTESLQLISQNPTLMAAQTDNQVTGSTEAKDNEPKTGDDTKKSDEADPKDEPEEPKDDKGDDDLEPTDDDDGSDDFGTDDDSADNEFDVSHLDDGDDGGEPGGSGADDNSGMQTDSTPDNINTSDDQGIEFTITPPEMATVDSVLYREEMYKFLTNVLTNPPKCMSPQDIATLTALKRYWLSCLSIETIKGIVEACVRLPKSVKLSLHKSTELNK